MFEVADKLDDRHIPRCFAIAKELCAEGAEIDEDGRDYFVELTAQSAKLYVEQVVVVAIECLADVKEDRFANKSLFRSQHYASPFVCVGSPLLADILYHI